MSDERNSQDKPGRIWRRRLLFGVPVVGAGMAFAAGIVFWGGFNTAMEATNTMSFCISCHEMRENVYKEYRHTIHYQNRSGVQATCSDCHVPDPWVHKVVRKVKATRELYGKLAGTIDTPEKFEANRLRLARNVWQAMKDTDSRECRNCHTIESMAPEFQRPRARQQHLTAMETGQTCIDCHKGIAHKGIRDLVPEEELEALEAPDPRHIKVVPEMFLASLAYIEKVEAEAAEKAATEKAAAEAAIAERIAAAVAAATAAQGDSASSGGDGIAPGIDWAAVPGVPVTLFYPRAGVLRMGAERARTRRCTPLHQGWRPLHHLPRQGTGEHGREDRLGREAGADPHPRQARLDRHHGAGRPRRRDAVPAAAMGGWRPCSGAVRRGRPDGPRPPRQGGDDDRGPGHRVRRAVGLLEFVPRRQPLHARRARRGGARRRPGAGRAAAALRRGDKIHPRIAQRDRAARPRRQAAGWLGQGEGRRRHRSLSGGRHLSRPPARLFRRHGERGPCAGGAGDRARCRGRARLGPARGRHLDGRDGPPPGGRAAAEAISFGAEMPTVQVALADDFDPNAQVAERDGPI